MLALFNARHSIRARFEGTAKSPSGVMFTEPDFHDSSPSPGRRHFLLHRLSKHHDTNSTKRRNQHRFSPSDALNTHIVSLLPSPDSSSPGVSNNPFASPLDTMAGKNADDAKYNSLPLDSSSPGKGDVEGLEGKYVPYRGYGRGRHERGGSESGTGSGEEDYYGEAKDADEGDPFRPPA